MQYFEQCDPKKKKNKAKLRPALYVTYVRTNS
jgi:hypothetical protein